MKKKKIIRGIILLSSLIFLFLAGSRASASSGFLDVCNSELKKDFKSFCEKNENIASPLDIFKQKEGIKVEKTILMSETKNETEFVDNNGNGIDDNDEIIITGTEEWLGDRIFDNKIVAVMPGAELKIGAGVKVSLKNSFFAVAGKLIAEGTAQNPIIFKALEDSDNQGFIIYSGLDSEGIQGDEIIMHHVDISGGNGAGEFGVLTVGNAKLEMKESSMHNNGVAISVAGNMPEEKLVNHTKFFDNEIDVMGLCMRENIFPNFQYNWWGPAGLITEEYCDGENVCWEMYKNIYGYASVRPWFVSEDFHDPVIIVPGIMGSATKYVGGIGEMELDPILGTYKNLIDSFEKNGYEKDKNLFEFPYEWRDSNVLISQKLKEKINEVKAKTGLPAVDLVAHSMGGLVARYYVEGNNYEDDVNQLITLGTPHKGSPKGYTSWEAGEIGVKFEDNLVEFLFKNEAHILGYENLKDYIQSRVISVKELLPDYNYLQEVSNGEMRNYPNNYPQNNFLEFLNDQNRLDNLKKISFTNIIGNVDGNKTITKFRVADSEEEGRWEHGMPENFYDKSTDQGIEYGSGDETVPFYSADGVAADNKEEIDSSHNDLPTVGQCDVINNLAGKNDCEYFNTFDKVKDILTFGIFSPIDIQVIAPDGKKVGKNIGLGGIINEIPNAFYSGFETDNEFLTIPNPQDGEYKVITQGTGNDAYRIEMNRISENAETGKVKEISASIAGSAQTGNIKETKVQISQEEIAVIEENITAGSIIEKINQYYAQGLIKKKNDRNFLIARLKLIQEVQAVLEKFKENKFINKKVKERIISQFENLINWNLDFLIDYIKIRSKAGAKSAIDLEAGKSLIEDLNFIKYK
jgi:pimeloyl-ACP methyl ester carboxylesterase